MIAESIKEKVLKAINEMPADASYEDIMERLYVLYKIEQGLREVEAGAGVPHEEARVGMKRWHG